MFFETGLNVKRGVCDCMHIPKVFCIFFLCVALCICVHTCVHFHILMSINKPPSVPPTQLDCDGMSLHNPHSLEKFLSLTHM